MAVTMATMVLRADNVHVGVQELKAAWRLSSKTPCWGNWS